MSQQKRWIEEDLAQELGISRDEFKRLRGALLRLGHHYSTYKGHVVISRAGRAVLLQHIHQHAGTSQGAPSSAGPVTSAPPPPAAPGATRGSAPLLLMDRPKPPPMAVPLVVFKLPLNKKLIMAQTPAGTVVRVRVSSSQKFIRGMKIVAKQIQGDLYELHGRMPRFRGKF